MSLSNAGWKGGVIAYPINWKRELERDRHGAIMSAPSCFKLEHRNGICPHGYKHDVDRAEFRNMVVNGWYSACLDHARDDGAAVDLGITYVSVGTGGSATLPTDVALGAEVYRDLFTDRQKLSDTEQVHYFFFDEASANFYHHEYAAWCGSPSATLDSGVMVARWLWDYDKDSDKTLNGQWTFARA